MPQLMKRFEAPFESHEIYRMKNKVVCIPSEKKRVLNKNDKTSFEIGIQIQ